MTSPDTGTAVSPLARFEATLRSAVDSLAEDKPFAAPEAMLAVEARLRETVFPGVSLPGKYVCRAVSAFHARGVAALTLRDLRSLCMGLEHACDACGGKRVLDAPDDALRALCVRLKEAFAARKLEVESWYDLMQAYLRLKERAAGGGMIQDVLAGTFPLARAASPYPFAWLRVMDVNSDIIGSDPCKASAIRTLAGNFGELDALRKALGISCSSWFWKELTVACAAQITQLKTAAFTGAVPEMLQVSRFLPPSLRNEILRIFLEHSLQCRELGPPPALRDFVVEHWGQPPLGQGTPYDLVSADARRMVQEWVVQDDLADFMTLLHADRAEGERRLAFWTRYVRSIDFHRILLRSQSMQEDESPAAARVKKKSSSGRLAGALGTANVLLLKIGNWVIVETGDSGGAIYGYRYGRLPFGLEADAIAIPCLRNEGPCDFKAVREDTLEGMWEDKLGPELATLGLRRDESASSPIRKKPQPATKEKPAAQEDDGFIETEFHALASELQLMVEDLRPDGGGLWVTSDLMENHYAVQKLSGWGFSWNAGRGWRKY